MMKQQNLIGYLDDTVDIIEELPANIVGKIISNTSLEKRQLINQFLKYDYRIYRL